MMQFSRPSGNGWVKLTATVDSGSTENATNEESVENVETEPSPQSIRGVSYECANSGTVTNDGQKICETWAEGFRGTKKMILQVAKVHKTLLSVYKLEKAGHSVIFSNKYGAYIENDYTGERVYMKRKGGLYEVDLWVRSFRRPSP